jgi:cytochrome c oxidase assembly protein subunit 15
MRFTPARYRQIAIWALIALSVIVVSGAGVRLSGSGLGCDDWPRCNSERLIDVSSTHAAIEQGNRLFTGVVGVAVIMAVLGAYRRVPFRRDLPPLAWMLVYGVLLNAIVGGISVLVDLHPMWVQSHFLISMFTIVVGTVLIRRAGEPDGVPRRRMVDAATEKLVWLHFALSCLAIFTGTVVTGSGPHAGDETAERLDIAISTAAQIHGVTVVTTLVVALVLAARVWRGGSGRGALQLALSRWIAIGAAQAVIGYTQYFTGVPVLLVALHIVGAIAVMWASTLLLLDTRRAVTPVDESLSAELVRT